MIAEPRNFFDKAIKEEIKELIKRKICKVASRNKVPENSAILGGRYVLAIKDE